MAKSKLDILRHRLRNQQLSRRKFRRPEEIVKWLGAVQAQDYNGSLWGIGLRLPTATIKDVERAISDRKIIRTWPMRGTLHFVPAADARWMLELMAPRIIEKSRARYRELGLNENIFERSEKILSMALRGSIQMTRSEMYSTLAKKGVKTAGQRGYHILGHLAQKGVICFGARREKQHTMALLDEWAPDRTEMKRNEALAEIAARYFTSHGPATLQDFMWWTGLKAKDARMGAEAAAGIEKLQIGGRAYLLPEDIPGGASGEAHLLPPFDEYLISYKDKSAAIGKKIDGRVNPAFSSSIILNGKAIGMWKRTVRKDGVAIAAAPFRKLSKSEKSLVAGAADRYARFLGQPRFTLDLDD